MTTFIQNTGTVHRDERFTPLTWLRAIAALLVVIHHSILAGRDIYTPSDESSSFILTNMLGLGTFAVYLFFALSGCTLTLSSHTKITSTRSIAAFYVKRLMRIWPNFIFSLFIYIIFIEIFSYFYVSDKSLWIALFLKEYSIINIIQYITLTFNFTGPEDLFNSSYWSLPIEFQYYLLLAPVLLIMRGKYFLYIPPLIASACMYAIYKYLPGLIDDMRLFKMAFCFFGGVLIASIYPKISFRISTLNATIIAIIGLFFLGLIRNNFVTVPSHIPFISDKWNLYAIFSLFFVSIAIITTPPEKNNLFLKTMERCGEISYSIYLFHMIFIGLSVLLVIHIELLNGSSKILFILFVSIICSYLMSCITYKYIEVPFIEYGKRMSKKITSNEFHKSPIEKLI